jgi:hypothetical protein
MPIENWTLTTEKRMNMTNFEQQLLRTKQPLSLKKMLATKRSLQHCNWKSESWNSMSYSPSR